MRRNADELKKMRKAGRVVAEMHEAIRAAVKPGVTTKKLDDIGRAVIEKRGARSNFLGYMGTYPAVICASPNDTVVHGIPGKYRLKEGDIISIDCGAIVQGYHGDAAFTMGVGEISEEAARLIQVTEQSLYAGIAEMVDGNRIGDIGHAVQGVVEAAGFSVVKEYVGHAIGTEMHEKPEVPTYGKPGKGPSEFNTVHGIAVDNQRRIYVCDRANSRIQIFDENGKYLDEWNNIRYPYYIYMSKDQHLWVGDGYTQKILKYDLNGKLLSSWGTFGQFPGGIWGPHQFSVDSDNNLYIADVHIGRVQKLQPKPGVNPALLVGQR